MSWLYFIGTFLIIIFLKWFRNTRFFVSGVRGVLANFAIFIAIITMTIMHLIVQIPVPTLDVPREFKVRFASQNAPKLSVKTVSPLLGPLNAHFM